MPATMTIDQAGLPAGAAGKARTDGLATGALVTLTSVGGGTTHRFELLWAPLAANPAPVVTQTGPTTWQFTPPAAVYGTYRIRLIVDEGLSTEDSQIRIFGIRTPSKLLRLPALNEIASASASLENDGADQVDASEDNEDVPGRFAAGNYGGWYRELDTAFAAIEAGGGGSGVARAYLTGASGQLVTTLGSEVLLGGFVFDGSVTFASRVLRAYGTVVSAVANVDVRLYDMGPPGSPAAGILRSTINLATLGVPLTGTQTLTPNGAPGVNVNQIFNTARMYELRAIVNAAAPGDTFRATWLGLELS